MTIEEYIDRTYPECPESLRRDPDFIKGIEDSFGYASANLGEAVYDLKQAISDLLPKCIRKLL